MSHRPDDSLARDLRTRAAALVRRGWCQDVLAQDAYGTPVSWLSPRACRFCLWGALVRAGEAVSQQHPYVFMETLNDVMDDLRQDTGVYDLHVWNDTPGRTAAEVVALLTGKKEPHD